MLDSLTWTCHRDGKLIDSSDLQIGPHSVDVSLGGIFITPELIDPALVYVTVLDPYKDKQPNIQWKETRQPFYDLKPGHFVLAHVRERFTTTEGITLHRPGIQEQVPNVNGLITKTMPTQDSTLFVTQCYDGRSTVGRLGIMSHVTAGYGDYGFVSNFTLELHNVNPRITVRLHEGMRIGQISFHGIETDGALIPMYEGAYTRQHDVPVAPSLGASRFLQPGESVLK
jgi:deoxycytidine triphosphate deaminase